MIFSLNCPPTTLWTTRGQPCLYLSIQLPTLTDTECVLSNLVEKTKHNSCLVAQAAIKKKDIQSFIIQHGSSSKGVKVMLWSMGIRRIDSAWSSLEKHQGGWNLSLALNKWKLSSWQSRHNKKREKHLQGHWVVKDNGRFWEQREVQCNLKKKPVWQSMPYSYCPLPSLLASTTRLKKCCLHSFSISSPPTCLNPLQSGCFYHDQQISLCS